MLAPDQLEPPGQWNSTPDEPSNATFKRAFAPPHVGDMDREALNHAVTRIGRVRRDALANAAVGNRYSAIEYLPLSLQGASNLKQSQLIQRAEQVRMEIPANSHGVLPNHST